MEQITGYNEITEEEALGSSKMGFKIAGQEEKEEETLEQRFQKMVTQLMHERSWSPRKATRFLNSMARRNVRKQFGPKGNGTINSIFNRYRYIPANARAQQRIQEQKEYAEQVKQQIETMEQERALTV